jgi:hypothetical protein
MLPSRLAALLVRLKTAEATDWWRLLRSLERWEASHRATLRSVAPELGPLAAELRNILET